MARPPPHARVHRRGPGRNNMCPGAVAGNVECRDVPRGALLDSNSMHRQGLLERFPSVVAEEGIYPRRDNLKFYLDFLFDSVPLAGKSVLDVGSGTGMFGFYARCVGAARVVCLEPQRAGSSTDMIETFRRMDARLGVQHLVDQSAVDVEPEDRPIPGTLGAGTGPDALG